MSETCFWYGCTKFACPLKVSPFSTLDGMFGSIVLKEISVVENDITMRHRGLNVLLIGGRLLV